MKNTILLVILFLSTAVQAQLSPSEIIKKSEDKYRGDQSYAELEMKIVRKDWTKTMTMKAWAIGQDLSMIMITGPAREKGTVILRVEKNVWNWQPKIERVIKMPPSAMSQSWMGSDFSNDDLVKESSLTEDFIHTMLKDTTIEGLNCYMIELLPKDDADIIWGKVVLCISKKEFIQMKVAFYDEDLYLVNTMLASDLGTLGGKYLPKTLTIYPADEPDQKTIMTYQALDFKTSIEEEFFTVQNMKRLR